MEPPLAPPAPDRKLTAPPLLDVDAPLTTLKSAPTAPPLTPTVMSISPDVELPEFPVAMLICPEY